MRQIKEKQKIIVVVGPTASGKSALAVNLAKKIGGEIISADSRQVYKGMDIGAGKITKKEMAGIPHYLLSFVSPKKTFTAAQFKVKAEKTIKQINRKGKIPIICGGTGFYIDSLIYDWQLPEVPPQTELRKKLEKKTTEELFKILANLDPKRSKTIDKKNRRRLIRAIEIAKFTKKPIPFFNVANYSRWQKNKKFNALFIGFKKSPIQLKKLIKIRLAKRISQGMIKEVKNLHQKGTSWKKLDSFGLEYRYISKYLQGILSKKEMKKELAEAIWKYTKRQLTWFKRNPEIHWITSENEALKLAKDFSNNRPVIS